MSCANTCALFLCPVASRHRLEPVVECRRRSDVQALAVGSVRMLCGGDVVRPRYLTCHACVSVLVLAGPCDADCTGRGAAERTDRPTGVAADINAPTAAGAGPGRAGQTGRVARWSLQQLRKYLLFHAHEGVLVGALSRTGQGKAKAQGTGRNIPTS